MRKPRRITSSAVRGRSKGAGQPWYARVVADKWFLNGIFAFMLLGLVALALQQIWSRAQTADAFAIHAWQWNTEIPPYITLTKQNITDRLSQDDFLAQRHSIFDKDIEKDIAARYETFPFIRKVTLIQKRFPNSLHVEVEWRMPAAKVRCGGGEFLIDGDGVVLEPVYDVSKLDYIIPFIDGFPGDAPAPVAGTKWQGDDVVAAAKMAEFLRPLLKDLARMQQTQQCDPITTISVRNFGNVAKSRILLLTAGGKVIEWGNPLTEESSNEPRPERKLANLQKIYANSPALTAYKDQPLKTFIALQWLDTDFYTSDNE